MDAVYQDALRNGYLRADPGLVAINAPAPTPTPTPEAEDLRPAETGLVMVRGRIGGDGRAFNAGEATVTRAAVRLPGGETGFAYHLGRDRTRARLAAILDAHWQRPEARPALESALEAIAGRRAEAVLQAARKTAATRVNFFTLARGED